MIFADRDMVETDSESILRDADKEDVALLVVGDPFGYVPLNIEEFVLTVPLPTARPRIRISCYELAHRRYLSEWFTTRQS